MKVRLANSTLKRKNCASFTLVKFRTLISAWSNELYAIVSAMVYIVAQIRFLFFVSYTLEPGL